MATASRHGVPAVNRANVKPWIVVFGLADGSGVTHRNTGKDRSEFVLVQIADGRPAGKLAVSFPEPDVMAVQGPLDGQDVRMTLRRIPPPKKEYPLRRSWRTPLPGQVSMTLPTVTANMATATLPPDHAARMDRARIALDGLSVGDALGQTCFHPDNYGALIEDPRATARAPWERTDDTAMALGILDVLDRHGRIDQPDLAATFARRFDAEPYRGYGGGAIRDGADWRAAAGSLFGSGSFGNGSAMRIAPLAAYFAEDGLERVAEQAALSAAVTHAHPEGLAGGIATAVAAAYAWLNRDRRTDADVKRGLFDAVLAHTPAGEVRDGIERAAGFAFDVPAEPAVRLVAYGAAIVPFDTSLEPLVRTLGNGSLITCQDTVPMCLRVATRHLDDYQSAVVAAIRARGDIDTNAAIVGGIVALATGANGIPKDWHADRERVPA